MNYRRVDSAQTIPAIKKRTGQGALEGINPV